MTALRNSLVVALGSAILATTIGGASAYALYRYDYRFGALLAGLTTVPTLLPPVILGVAFMTFFVSLGVVGQVSNLVVAHAVFVTPFPFVLISQGLDEVDRSYEEASRNLGASRLTTLRTITLPLVRANVFSGALFAFILSLNEYIIAWLVAGFAFKTIPIQIFTSLRYSYSPIIAAISVVFILATVAVMFGIDRLSGGIWE
nr:ABC transporter permease [Halarchaeum solikamskense]